MLTLGIVLITIGIIIVAWILLIKDPLHGESDPTKDTLIDDTDGTALTESKTAEDLEIQEGRLARVIEILDEDIQDREIQLIWDIFKENQTDLDYFILIANRLLAKNSPDRARDVLAVGAELNESGKSAESTGKGDELLILLGDLELKLGNNHAAMASYEKAIAINPNARKALSSLASTYIATEDFDKAIETLEKALKGDPDDLKPRLFLGITLYHSKRYEDAYLELNKVFKKDPRIPQTHYFIGATLYELGEPKIAEKALKKYLELQPEGGYSIDAERILAKIPE